MHPQNNCGIAAFGRFGFCSRRLSREETNETQAQLGLPTVCIFRLAILSLKPLSANNFLNCAVSNFPMSVFHNLDVCQKKKNAMQLRKKGCPNSPSSRQLNINGCARTPVVVFNEVHRKPSPPERRRPIPKIATGANGIESRQVPDIAVAPFQPRTPE